MCEQGCRRVPSGNLPNLSWIRKKEEKVVFIPPVIFTFKQSLCLLSLSLCKSMVICEPLRHMKKQGTASRLWGARKLCLPKPSAGDTGPLQWVTVQDFFDAGQHPDSICLISSLFVS